MVHRELQIAFYEKQDGFIELSLGVSSYDASASSKLIF